MPPGPEARENDATRLPDWDPQAMAEDNRLTPHRSRTTTMSGCTPASLHNKHTVLIGPTAYIVVFKDHATREQIQSYVDDLHSNGASLVLNETASSCR
jgi:hypothetical protein